MTVGADHDVEIRSRLGGFSRTVARIVDVDEAATVLRDDTARQRQVRVGPVAAAAGAAFPSSDKGRR